MPRKTTVIEPFWNRFPQFFLYPLTPPALYVLLGLAVINAAPLDLARAGMPGSVIALVLGVSAFVFSIKYGYDILERTAHGQYGSPPPLNRATLVDGYELPFKQIGVFIVLGIVGALIGSVLPIAALLYAVLVLALLPAIVVTLALERTMVDALNPANLFRVAFRIGWPYFAVFGLMTLLNGGSATVSAWFGQGLPLGARAFVGAFAQNFFWFVNMNLLGYLVYQYHGRIGFEPESIVGQDDPWQPVLEPVYDDIDAGNYGLAADRLKSLVLEYPEHATWLRQQRHKALKLSDREDDLLHNGGTLLAQLIDANRMREAAEVYIDLTDVDRKVRPAREGDYEPLMDMLVQRGEYRRAVRLANGFHRDFPESSSIPPLYLEVARVFLEHLDDPARARQIADFLIRHYPDHPAATRARNLRAAVTS